MCVYYFMICRDREREKGTFQLSSAERDKPGGDEVVHVLSTAEIILPMMP